MAWAPRAPARPTIPGGWGKGGAQGRAQPRVLTPIAFHLANLDRLLGALDTADRYAPTGLRGRSAVSIED